MPVCPKYSVPRNCTLPGVHTTEGWIQQINISLPLFNLPLKGINKKHLAYSLTSLQADSHALRQEQDESISKRHKLVRGLRMPWKVKAYAQGIVFSIQHLKIHPRMQYLIWLLNKYHNDQNRGSDSFKHKQYGVPEIIQVWYLSWKLLKNSPLKQIIRSIKDTNRKKAVNCLSEVKDVSAVMPTGYR